MAITYIDFYAENPIENKTIADSCIFENINGDGNALWTIYNSNDITITAEDTLYLNADRMWFNSSVEWTTIVSNSGMGFTTNPNSSGYSFTWNANGGIWDVDTKGGDVRFNTYNSTSATYGTMVFPPVDKLQIAGGTNGQVLTTNGSGVLSWTTVGGGVSDGEKGDITVSGSGSVWTIDNSVVTYGKMQNASGHSVLGRSANTSGAIGEITSTANGQVLHRNGSNLVFGTIGDSSITASSITYSRLQNVSTNNRLLGRSTAGAGSIEEITVGSGLTLTSGTLSASGGVTDGDKGDITVSGSGATWTIDNQAVTFAKMQNLSNNVLLGRDQFTSGSPQQITLGTNLSLSGTTLNATGGGVTDGDKGDITVTNSGATWTIDNQAVTFAKIQNVTGQRLVGNWNTPTGTINEINLSGGGLAFSGSSLQSYWSSSYNYGSSLTTDTLITSSSYTTVISVSGLNPGTYIVTAMVQGYADNANFMMYARIHGGTFVGEVTRASQSIPASGTAGRYTNGCLNMYSIITLPSGYGTQTINLDVAKAQFATGWTNDWYVAICPAQGSYIDGSNKNSTILRIQRIA